MSQDKENKQQEERKPEFLETEFLIIKDEDLTQAMGQIKQEIKQEEEEKLDGRRLRIHAVSKKLCLWLINPVQEKELDRLFKKKGLNDDNLKLHQKNSQHSSNLAERSREAQEWFKRMHTYAKQQDSSEIATEETKKKKKYHPKYPCDICGKLLNASDVVRHKQTEHNQNYFNCNECNKSYKYRHQLQNHQVVHSDDRSYACKFCNTCFKTRSNLMTHLSNHMDNKRYLCEICSKQFRTKSQLTIHYRSHTGDKPYKCNVCQKSFSQNCDMQRHMRIHTGEKPHACKFCTARFAALSNCRMHEKRHTGEYSFQCAHCNRGFIDKNHLVRHLRLHTGEKPFSCVLCGKNFSQRSNLRIHEKVHRKKPAPTVNKSEESPIEQVNQILPNSQKPAEQTHNSEQQNSSTEMTEKTKSEKGYPCDICDKVLKSESSVAHHQKTQHSFDCNKNFKSKPLLQQQQLVHSDDQPYACKSCNACFKSKAELSNHQSIHTGKKMFQCKICSKRFAHESQLTVHSRVHSGLKPHKYETRLKSFSQCFEEFLGNLHEDVSIHNDVKFYTCKICGRSFTQLSSFKKHEKRHKEDCLYQCAHCSRDFTRKAALTLHLRMYSDK